MSQFNLLRRISILFIVYSCPIIRAVETIRYFKCTNDVQLFHKTECTQDCVATEMQLKANGTIHDGTSAEPITTDTFNDMLSSIKTSNKVVNDYTTLLTISEDSLSELGVAVLNTSTSSEGLSTTVTHQTILPREVTPLGSTGSQFNDQTTIATKTQSTHAAEQLKFSTSTTDLKMSTEKTFTSLSNYTTESNRPTTHELTSKTVSMNTTRTIQHTISHLSTTKDHPTTKEENSTSKTISSERNITTKAAHTSKLNPLTTETRSVRQNSTSISTHTWKQETSTKQVRTTKMSSTTDQEINTTELPFSTMTTSSRHNHSYFTTARPTTPPSCPTNMLYLNCTCQSTCEYPNNCYNNCLEAETCICPDGFYLMGGNCVPHEECSCYHTDKGLIIQEGASHLIEGCTKQCSCLSGVLTCYDFQCDSNAICQYESGIAQCHCNDGYHGDGLSCTRLTDCKDVHDAGLVDYGVYTILPRNWTGSAFEVYCKDGWTVFQRREDGSVDFFRYWADYKEGFGDVRHEMWLGLEKLHYLTYQSISRLKISLVSDGIPYEMNYSWFEIDSEENNYALKNLGSYSGNIGFDLLTTHHGFQFSTRDRDNDNHPTVDCANSAMGAWWFKQCYRIHLNGPYGSPEKPGICYTNISINYCNIPFTEMSIKPV